MHSLNEMSVLITGGGSGIGLGAAKHFGSRGAFVTISGRREEPLLVAAEQIGAKRSPRKNQILNCSAAFCLQVSCAVWIERPSFTCLRKQSQVKSPMPSGGVLPAWAMAAWKPARHRRVMTLSPSVAPAGRDGVIRRPKATLINERRPTIGFRRLG